MRINTNVSAIVSNNALQKAQDALSSSIQRLSSGYKINSSADDPAGCAISEKMRVQIRGLDQAKNCLLYTSPSPRDISGSRMPSSA